jgi:hypothetical protein
MGAFQNHLHALYGLPGGFAQSAVISDTHDGKPGGGRKKKKKKEEVLIKKGTAELRFIPKDDYKFSIRDAVRKDIQLTEDEEEFLIMLLMGDYDD